MAVERKSPARKASTPAKRAAAPVAKGGVRGRKPAPSSGATAGSTTSEERRRLIAEAAYLKAERRAFQGGSAEQDWIEAESEIDAKLGPSPAPAKRK